MSIALESKAKLSAVEYVVSKLTTILKRRDTAATHSNPATFDVTQELLRQSGFNDRVSFKKVLAAHLQPNHSGLEVEVRLIADNRVRISVSITEA